MKSCHLKSEAPPLAPLTRRRFLLRTARGAALAALLAGLPKGWVGSVYASDAPETAEMRFGMIALTDCSPIVIAHEKGFFKKYGIELHRRQGRELGRHPRLAFQRRQPGHAHAHRHADRLDDGPARFAEETDDHSVAAQSQRPGHHAQGRVEGQGGGRSEGAQAVRGARPRSWASR